MEAGNALAPVIVLAVTVTLVRKLFAVLEETRQALERERIGSASLREREQLARELHDGLSQSLFLLSVKLDLLDRADLPENAKRTSEQIRSTVKHIYEDVRQLIDNLRTPVASQDDSLLQSVGRLAAELEESGAMQVELDIEMEGGLLSSKEKVELLAIIREAMFNAQKHAQAERLAVSCRHDAVNGGFVCSVTDNGSGVRPQQMHAAGRYGIRMMRERAEAMGWTFRIESPASVPGENGGNAGTRVEIAARRRTT
jgi:two-component system nitrate/nitrite sensor histidine kinase NarQ